MKNEKISKIYSQKKVVSCNGAERNSPHPKVYLNLLPKGTITCPYCSIQYTYQAKKQNA